LKHILCVLLLTSIAAVGGTITFNGPEFFNGTSYMPCTPGIGHCIDGAQEIYEVYSLSITSPSNPGGLWNINLQTNYGVAIPAGSVIPKYGYSGDPSFPEHEFTLGDILFMWNGNFYGIAMSNHDGYTAGNLYKANGFLTSQQVLLAGGVPPATQGGVIPRPTLAVELAGGGTQVGSGALNVTPNGGNGLTFAEYTITDSFSAPSNFLNSAFSVFDTSYACANGYLEGDNGGGFNGGTGGTTPEPGSWLLILPGLVLVGIARLRKNRA